MKNKLTKHEEKRLTDFLRRHRKDNALSLLQTKGFLFIVTCCPELVQPSEWAPLILGDTSFKNDEEGRQIMDYLITLYNQTNSQILNGTAKLPKECRLLPDTMSNFYDPAPIHQWAQGFMNGYSWLSDTWNDVFENEEADYEFNANLMALGIAADRDSFDSAFADEMDEDERLNMAKKMLSLLPVAIKDFADIALSLRSEEPSDPRKDGAVH